MDKRGISSARDMGERLGGVAPTTLMDMMYGSRSTGPDIIRKVADLLGVPVAKIYELRGEPGRTRFEMPVEADYLTQRQRRAVLGVVQAMLRPDPGDDSRDVSRAADTPAADKGLPKATKSARRRRVAG
jgi:hypothetical protein